MIRALSNNYNYDYADKQIYEFFPKSTIARVNRKVFQGTSRAEKHFRQKMWCYCKLGEDGDWMWCERMFDTVVSFEMCVNQ